MTVKTFVIFMLLVSLLMLSYNFNKRLDIQACQLDVHRQELNALKRKPYNRPACLDEYLKPETKLPSMFYNSPEMQKTP